MSSPEIGVIRPEPKGQIYGAVRKFSNIYLGSGVFQDAFIWGTDLKKDFLGFITYTLIKEMNLI